mgnify:FL=1|tara:strand:- start:6234 stop:6674 length:441 start_codon:yes stop_codon:yes gene_type:complete
MKLKFIFLGKQDLQSTTFLIEKYVKRLNTYVKSELLVISEKNPIKLDKKITKHITRRTYLMILDENGILNNTSTYTKFIQKTISNYQTLIFIVGDAYGVPSILSDRADCVISLSKMTFPHSIARLILVEQTYRAFTILNNHPYHHE